LDGRIEWTIAYMERNLHRRLLMRELAEKVNLSNRQFLRLFRAESGFPPARYHKELRVRRAKGLLEQTFLSVKQVAASSGMDESHFVRDFRRSHGSTPAVHRATLVRQHSLALGTKLSTGNGADCQPMAQMANGSSLF
jgi:transcriptional regulator GlxA family with amidase domain